ncbi:MAG: choice-of-anchor J domain-containing protein [Bacteroidales bacterium]|nr:choice-of-anchor J domain-containing protein [Bacteroidales bacterium]
MDTAISGNDYMSIKLNLAPYAGQNITIAIENTTNGSPYLFIDDIAVRSTLAPVVTLPANANADANLAATFAAVITEGMLENMTYTWTSTMEAAGNATMSANDSLLTITYTAAGEDTITVVATNDHGSDTATMHVYVRLCEIVDSLPWSENFDSAAATECWTFVDADGNGASWTVNTSGYLYGQYNSAGPDDWAITPAIAVPDDADNLVLSWDVYGDSYLGLNNFYQVRVSPSAGMAIANFTDTLFSESYPTAVWTTRTAAISQYAGQTVRFAFRHINTGDDNGMRIDNVAVRTSLNPILSVSGPGSVQLGDTAIFTATLNEGSTDGLTFTFTSQDANAIASTDSNVYTIVYTATGTDTITVVATNTYGADTVVMPVNIIDFNPASLPYTCGFEPEGQDTSWFIDNHNVNGWYIDTAAHNGGSYSLYISADSGATYGYTVSSSSVAHAYRAIRFNQAGQYSVSFDWQADGESTYDFIRAYMAPIDATLPTSYSGITYGSLPAGFIAIDGGNRLNQSTGWQNVGTALTIDAPTTMLMVFSWRNDFSSGTQPPAAIDNIDVRMLSCLQPTALAVDSTGADFVAFSWVPAGEETSWEVTFNGESTMVTDTFYVADDLEANTEYSISVRAICGEGDTSFATSATTRTECGAITLPYHEGFENGGEACWRFATTGTYSNYYSINTYNYAEGTHSLRLYMNNIGNKSYAIMPELDNVNTLMVTFQNYDYYDELNQLEVGTMASPTDIASFVPFFSTVGTDTWEAQEVRFDADTTGNRYIAFRATATTASATYILIDDVTVMVAPSCHRPESVSATDIEATSATITITDTTEVNNYQIIVVNTATGDTAYSDLVNSTSQEVTGLTAFTEYTVTVYAVCDDGTITSSVNTTFRTACENGNCEFTVAMADTYGDGWNGNAINVWQNGELFTSLTIANGSAANANVSVCLGSPVELIWQSGSYAYETSFTITSADDSVILALDGDSLDSGDTLVVFDGLCGVQFVYSGDIVDTTEPEPGPQPLPCDAPTITGATATDNNVTVIWNGTASNYEVAIVEGAWQEPADVVTTTGPGYTFTGLQASTQYTVGVRAVCADTVSDWATRNVTTAAPADTTDTIGIRLAETALFSLYPNPATTTVTVDLGSHSQATVAVIDQSGRLNGEWRVENGKLELNVGRLAKGAYYVRVTTAESTSVRKLIVR